jgi:hypothetical protein
VIAVIAVIGEAESARLFRYWELGGKSSFGFPITAITRDHGDRGDSH